MCGCCSCVDVCASVSVCCSCVGGCLSVCVCVVHVWVLVCAYMHVTGVFVQCSAR